MPNITARRAEPVLRALCLGLMGLAATPAGAVTLDLPAGAVKSGADAPGGAIYLPVKPSAGGTVPQREYAGAVTRQVWRVDGLGDTHALMAPLRAQLGEQGFETVFDCDTEACGGFDFRFALEVLPEPAMHVDLGDFRYLLATSEAETVALVVSRRDSTGFVQITAIREGAAPEGGGTEVSVEPGTEPAGEQGGDFTPGSLAEMLETTGHVVLDDLDFALGTTDLGEGPYASLQELAAYLIAHPDRQIALVGHTDAIGGLDVNITVSRRRAISVLERLARAYEVPKAQMTAQGVGYMAPRASNLTEEGRTANRRVEAVLISTE